MWGLSLCVYIYVHVSTAPEVLGLSGAGTTGSCEPPGVSAWDLNSGPLEEQCMFLIFEPSLAQLRILEIGFEGSLIIFLRSCRKTHWKQPKLEQILDSALGTQSTFNQTFESLLGNLLETGGVTFTSTLGLGFQILTFSLASPHQRIL